MPVSIGVYVVVMYGVNTNIQNIFDVVVCMYVKHNLCDDGDEY